MSVSCSSAFIRPASPLRRGKLACRVTAPCIQGVALTRTRFELLAQFQHTARLKVGLGPEHVKLVVFRSSGGCFTSCSSSFLQLLMTLVPALRTRWYKEIVVYASQVCCMGVLLLLQIMSGRRTRFDT
jgi:hypothetical protein